MSRVSVIGAGSWGTAMAGLVAPHADEVLLWGREPEIVAAINETHKNSSYLTDYELPHNVFATTDLAETTQAGALILAIPSAFLRSVCHNVAQTCACDTPVLVLSKGMELGSHMLMHEVAGSELGDIGRVAALSGPNHAEEVCKGTVSAAVIASDNKDVALTFQSIVGGPAFRAYISEDICGVEVCGAVKNIIAISCGIAAGLGCGDNTLAVLMTRGVAEMGRVVTALGGNPLTCAGLAGMGDLIVTCTSQHSRNRTFGEALVAGESLEHYEARRHMVVEGAQACKSILELAYELKIEVPITRAVHAILYEGVAISDATDMLLGRASTEEFYGFNS